PDSRQLAFDDDGVAVPVEDTIALPPLIVVAVVVIFRVAGIALQAYGRTVEGSLKQDHVRLIGTVDPICTITCLEFERRLSIRPGVQGVVAGATNENIVSVASFQRVVAGTTV